MLIGDNMYERELNTRDNTEAVVGFSVGGKVVYNLVQRDPEFMDTGLSVVVTLNRCTNEFMQSVIESQKYPFIWSIFNDNFVFPDETPYSVYNIMDYNELLLYDHCYIYNVEEDVLIVRRDDGLIALEYKSDTDVQDFINIIK